MFIKCSLDCCSSSQSPSREYDFALFVFLHCLLLSPFENPRVVMTFAFKFMKDFRCRGCIYEER
jgi:hypothetical protein